MTGPSDPEGEHDPTFGGLLTIVGWIGAGAIGFAGVLAVLSSILAFPVSRLVVIGLGLALGGGFGGVANFLYTGDTAESNDETTAIVTDATTTTDPQPADLFDGHPDPVLYYDNGTGDPVVRAANESFGDTFDVPTGQLIGTPLLEVLLIASEEPVDADSVTSGTLDRVIDCETASGTTPFRLRTVGNEATGYVLYTPAETASSPPH